jgi:hypothetical protein
LDFRDSDSKEAEHKIPHQRDEVAIKAIFFSSESAEKFHSDTNLQPVGIKFIDSLRPSLQIVREKSFPA